MAKALRNYRTANYQGHKYKIAPAQDRVFNGIVFASKKEMQRYRELLMRIAYGEITDLILQPSFVILEPFMCSGIKYQAIRYVADFAYTTKSGKRVVEDVKGFKTKEYLLKKKMFLSRYGDAVIFLEI